MSEDLISRSALMKEIESLQVRVTGLRAGKGISRELMEHYRASVLKTINDAPTAYNVDKVVEQIKKKGSIHCLNSYCDGVCALCEYGVLVRNIIELVKAGGAE